ncbi:MAG: hypothetical protein NHG11_00840 [Candidatus Shikimatogenerans bostrichidophilus]|nr:MAG: hypothetical protein NHG11_00840 [Candidatus Shikimatogenerans bostrichidophilus]
MKYIYTCLYLPYKKINIKYLKINNNNKINYKIIKKFKKNLFKKILEILSNNNKKKLLGNLYF